MLIPYDLTSIGGRLLVHWLDPRNLDLQAGFFQQSINVLPDNERTQKLTSFTAFLDTPIAPAARGGLIFHTSRCGSTLLCQMLKRHPNALVLGEPVLINKIVKNATLTKSEKVLALRQSIAHLSQWAANDERCLLIKLSSWNLTAFDLFREAVNWPILCLYRHYLASLASLTNKPPSWLRKNYPTWLLGKNGASKYLDTGDQLTRATHMYLRLIESIENLLDQDADARLLNFKAIKASLSYLLNFFQLPVRSNIIEAIHEVTQFDAKTLQPFEANKYDSEIQRLQARLLARPELSHSLDQSYSRLLSHSKHLAISKVRANNSHVSEAS